MSVMPTVATMEGRATSGASTKIEPATKSEIEMHPNDPPFPTLPAPALSSHLRKAQVRAALFRKVEPVRVGRFILLQRLGAGSMGEIYAAYDERLDRRVALKLVRHGSQLTVKAEELLQREAQVLAQVSHPNVVQIYDVGTHDGRLFIAMELIYGQTLTRWLDSAARLPRPQRKREILRRFIAAGRGLEAAHAAGVAHRDFKPDNVLVGDDGRVRVVDFGLARAVVEELVRAAPVEPRVGGGPGAIAEDCTHGKTEPTNLDEPVLQSGEITAPFVTDSGQPGPVGPSPAQIGEPAAHPTALPAPRLTAATRLTETGMVMGTPRFMAPEQIRGAIADHRSDQFSFCVALYHALCGAFPFSGERPQELLTSIEGGNISLEHSAGMAAGLRKALRRGLAIDPSQRFANMGELLAALERSIRRRGGWIAGAVLLFLGAAAVYLWPSPAADPCAKAGDGISASWSDDRQAAVHTAFSRSNLPYADVSWRSTEQRINGYASRWRDEAVAACHVTYIDHAQSEQQFDRRMLCLERGRRQVSALVSELAAGAPEDVQRAVRAAEELPDLHACGHIENMMFGLEPPPAAAAGEVTAVRERLTQALTLEWLGRTEDSLVIARGALARADHLQYPPVKAEALTQVARALDGRCTADARTEAQELYFEALDIAEAERHDQLAASIWGRLVLLATRMDSGTQQARAWWRRNAAAIRRIGNSTYEQAKLHHKLGEIYYLDSKYAEATDEENRAIAAISGVPDQQLELSRYYDALAKSLEHQDRLDEAIQLHERALKIGSGELGVSHPDVIKLQINYGKALEKAGQLDRARSVLEAALASMPTKYRDSHIDAGRLHSFLSDLSYVEGRLNDAIAQAYESLQIYQRAGAPESLRAEAYTNIANAELRRGNLARALSMYEAALALRRGHLGSDHFQIGVNEGSVADALVGLAHYDEAMAHVLEAERSFEHGSGYDRAVEAWIRTVHGEVLVGQRKFGAAVPMLERALLLFDDTPPSSNPPRAMWALAQALHGLGQSADRVRQLAEISRMLFAKLGAPQARNRDAVAGFIGQLPVPRAPARDSSSTPSR